MNFQMWHRDMKWENTVEKMVPIDLHDAGLSQTFGLFIKKNHYLWSVIKQSIILIKWHLSEETDLICFAYQDLVQNLHMTKTQ